MKKGLLSIALILASAVTYAQVIFSVQTPSNIAGNYNMSYTDPGGGWSSPDMLDPMNAVTAELMFVEDGSSGDNPQGNPISREGCNPLINDLTGKIAVIYRNTCEFGTKVFNAQEAGAIAAIIINREDEVIQMGPGADGANVTIPAIFVSNVTGQTITDVMNAGGTVTAFIGNKQGLFDFDLGMVRSELLIPSPNTKPSRLVQAANENIQKLNAVIYNYGNLDQTNVVLKGEVTKDGATLYTQTVTAATLASGGSVLLNLPDYSSTTFTPGKYTLTYTLTSDATDEYDSDNIYSVDFYISEDVFSFASVDDQGMPIPGPFYRSTTATSSFGACIHFRDPNASRVQLEGVYFQASVNDPSVLTGQEFTIDVLSINEEDFIDFNNAPDQITFTAVNTSSYIFQEELENVNVFAPFSSLIDVEDNKRYLVCVTSFDVNTYIGYSNLDYSWVVDTLNQPVSPVISNDAINIVGFGEPAAALGLKMFNSNTAPVVSSATGLNEICEVDGNLVLTSTFSSSYQWNLDGNPISGATSQSYTATTEGNYTVTGGNGLTSSNFVVVAIDCSSLKENNIYNVSIYPNPAVNEINVTADSMKEFNTISLKDQLGRTVASWKVNKDIMKIDVSNIASGNYNMILEGANAISVQKVQIK
jgi:hypothetical protein